MLYFEVKFGNAIHDLIIHKLNIFYVFFTLITIDTDMLNKWVHFVKIAS